MAFILTPENSRTIEENMFREFEMAIVDSAHAKRELEPMVKLILAKPDPSKCLLLLHPTFQEEFIRLLVPYRTNVKRLLNSDIYNIAHRFREIIEKHGLIHFDYSTKFKHPSISEFESNYESIYQGKIFELNFMKKEARDEMLMFFSNYNSVLKNPGKSIDKRFDKHLVFYGLMNNLLTSFQLIDLFFDTFNDKTRTEGIAATADYLQKMAEQVD